MTQLPHNPTDSLVARFPPQTSCLRRITYRARSFRRVTIGVTQVIRATPAVVLRNIAPLVATASCPGDIVNARQSAVMSLNWQEVGVSPRSRQRPPVHECGKVRRKIDESASFAAADIAICELLL